MPKKFYYKVRFVICHNLQIEQKNQSGFNTKKRAVLAFRTAPLI